MKSWEKHFLPYYAATSNSDHGPRMVLKKAHKGLKIGRLRLISTLLTFAMLRAKSLFYAFSNFAAFSLVIIWMMQMMPEVCCVIELHSTGSLVSCSPPDDDHHEQDHHAPLETPCEEIGFCLQQCCGILYARNAPSISVQTKTRSDDASSLCSPINQAYVFNTSPPEDGNLILKRVLRPPKDRLYTQIEVFLC